MTEAALSSQQQATAKELSQLLAKVQTEETSIINQHQEQEVNHFLQHLHPSLDSVLRQGANDLISFLRHKQAEEHNKSLKELGNQHKTEVSHSLNKNSRYTYAPRLHVWLPLF